ncbi:MAG: histidine phosphatase family protein, partial [Campylobacter sp.]|nr:histidine phosphatase family protein [Campylobacter sp.]
MKEIYFIRHAKTEKIATAENLQIFCDEFGNKFLSGRGHGVANQNSDFVRNLNEIGREGAKILAQKLTKNAILSSVIITSSANRATQTAQIIANELKFNG